jgi:putative ABC transport system substrate-binding protein
MRVSTRLIDGPSYSSGARWGRANECQDRAKEGMAKDGSAAKTSGAQAVSSLQGPFFFFQRKLLGELYEKHAIPLAMSEPLAAEVGALLQVNPDIPGAAAASAKCVDRILKGAIPGDLPIERHATIQVVLNMKVARTLGLTVDPALAKGGRVID